MFVEKNEKSFSNLEIWAEVRPLLAKNTPHKSHNMIAYRPEEKCCVVGGALDHRWRHRRFFFENYKFGQRFALETLKKRCE